MHRRREVLQYLSNSRAGGPSPMVHSGGRGENYKMSEGTGDYVNLSAFLAVPRGTAPDPAKKVRQPYLYHKLKA